MKFSSDVTTLIALFAIVSPITSLPVFLNLTSEMTKRQRRITALKTAAVAGLTLMIAYFLGDIILRSLSIDMNSFKIAGDYELSVSPCLKYDPVPIVKCE